jgi:hypothetical protein
MEAEGIKLAALEYSTTYRAVEKFLFMYTDKIITTANSISAEVERKVCKLLIGLMI